MGRTVTATLHVHATPGAIAAVLPDRLLAGGASVDVGGEWGEGPWTRSLIAWRRSGSWQGGRRRGRLTIDLVPAGREWTLATVTLQGGPWWTGRAPVWSDAGAVARLVRSVAETGRPGVAHPPVGARSIAVPIDRSAPLAVGYSRP